MNAVPRLFTIGFIAGVLLTLGILFIWGGGD